MTDLSLLDDALRALGGHVAGPVPLLAVGWATVDLERTLAGMGPTAVDAGPVVEERALGARAVVVGREPVALVILEPATEGRLAAALARRGEGIVCLYVAGPPVVTEGSPLTALGRPGRLLAHDRPWGPFVMLVEREAGG